MRRAAFTAVWTVLVAASGFVPLTAFESIAHADVIPPDVDACNGKKAGDACNVSGSAGTCAASKCSRLDYANWDRDASPTPPTVEYDCVRCVSGATGGDGGASTGGDGGASTPTSKAEDSGCSFGSGVRRVGPWALAAVPGLAIALFGRRTARRARK
jgi:hypothetical protein